MIKVALPNKGMLFEPTQELLKACGYKASKPYKTLTQIDSKNGIEFFFLRPSDIPMYVGRGIIDAGITGIDFNAEAKSPAVKVLDLPFGASKLCAAVPNESPIQSLADLKDATIATSLPWMRRMSVLTSSSSVFCGLQKMAALERKSGSPMMRRPACLSVVPVSTTSTMAFATPRLTEISTAPSSTTKSIFFL